jgi:hypothetical protein
MIIKTRSDSIAKPETRSPTPSPTMTEENNLNPWFDAKRLLIADYKNGYILNDMDADQVHGMREEYLAVRPDRFFPNFNRLKKNGFKSTKAKEKGTTTNNKKNTTNKKIGEVNAWSIAKPLAHDDYLQGKITDDTDLDRLHGFPCLSCSWSFQWFAPTSSMPFVARGERTLLLKNEVPPLLIVAL